MNKLTLGSFIIALLCFATRAHAQPERIDLRPIDTVYKEKVKTVFINNRWHPTLFPYVLLGSEDVLNVSFDILEGTPQYLNVSFYHFNYDWTQSEMLPAEYLRGINLFEVRNFQTSNYTLVPYVHYECTVPVSNFLISGNYLLVVYNQDAEVLFTRRFYVTENSVLVSVKFGQPDNIQYTYTHHSLDITINTNKKFVQNDQRELKLMVMQNGNPHTTQYHFEPRINQGDLFYFNRLDGILFPAMKEFRIKDMSAINYRTQDIEYWESRDNKFLCWLKPDVVREYRPYYTENEINGSFLNYNKSNRSQPPHALEYVWAQFTLEVPRAFDDPVYVFGQLSDWSIKPDFKMEYDESRKIYRAEVLLKMGYYNHIYVLGKANGPDHTPLEGNWYETENQYQVVVYYRSMVNRYDQILFAGTFNSNL